MIRQKNSLSSRLFCLLLILLLGFFSAPSFPSYADGWPSCTENIEAEGAVLMDAKSGTVLYAKNEHAHYYPASITKVLTAIVVLEHVENLETKMTFSTAATKDNLEPNSTVIGAVAGDKLSVRDCLYSLLLHSANDCANALAEYVAGSNSAFAELMNEKAQAIGCTDSHFTNPSGLNNAEHYTSAMDMAKIMQYAIQNKSFLQIDATQVYTHAPISKYPNPEDKENTVYAHHKMMRKSYREYYEGVFAGKTGYTLLAGNTLPKGIPFQDVASDLHYDLSEEEKAEGKIAKIEYRYEDRIVGTAYIYLEDEKTSNENSDLSKTSLKKEEAIHKKISVELQKEEENTEESVDSNPEKQNNAPLIFDKKAGKIILQKPILKLLKILLSLSLLTVLGLLAVYLFQRREEFYRARRRKRMLKHTKDLSREQKAKRDLLLEKKRRQKKERT